MDEGGHEGGAAHLHSNLHFRKQLADKTPKWEAYKRKTKERERVSESEIKYSFGAVICHTGDTEQRVSNLFDDDNNLQSLKLIDTV